MAVITTGSRASVTLPGSKIARISVVGTPPASSTPVLTGPVGITTAAPDNLINFQESGVTKNSIYHADLGSGNYAVSVFGYTGISGERVRIAEGLTTVFGGIRLANYSMASLPSATGLGSGTIIYITNESGGAVLAFSDGGNWRRVTDRAVIS